MKSLSLFILLVSCCVATFGKSTIVTPMQNIPKKMNSFANDLYADVSIDKKHIQLFLVEGTAKSRLSEEDWSKDEATGRQNKNQENSEESQAAEISQHGSGVFTDQHGIVYFWRLESPHILRITSQRYESTFLILKENSKKS